MSGVDYASARFVYRIPIVIRLLFGGLLAMMTAAEAGYFKGFMPSGDFFKPGFTILFCVALPVLIFSPYRRSHVEFHDSYFTLPRLFIPPFRKKTVHYLDVVSIREKSDQNAMHKAKIRTRHGNMTINSYFCYDSTLLTVGSPDEYFDLIGELRRRAGHAEGAPDGGVRRGG